MIVTYDITIETRMTETETKFKENQIYIAEIIRLSTQGRASNTPGNVTLML